MTHADWHAALLAEPTDDVTRLAFADWLEEHGEADRAAWVRLSVDEWRASDREPKIYRHAALAALRKGVWPAAYKPVPGVSVEAGLGRATVAVAGATGVKRAGGCRWLPDALATAWVGRASFRPNRDADVLAWPALWAKRPGLPWAAFTSLVCPSVLRAALDCPTLVEFMAGVTELSPAAFDALLARPTLRTLLLRTHNATDDAVRAAAERVATGPHLRGLTFVCVDGRPTEADLLAAVRNPALRRLTLVAYPPHPLPPTAAVRAARPDLSVREDRK